MFCFHQSDPSWVHSWPEFNHWTFTQVHTEVVDFQFICFSIPLNFNIFCWLLFKLFYDHSFLFCLVHVCKDQLKCLLILKCCLFIFVGLSTAWTQPPHFVGTAEKLHHKLPSVKRGSQLHFAWFYFTLTPTFFTFLIMDKYIPFFKPNVSREN